MVNVTAPGYAAEEVFTAVRSVLNTTRLLAMATVSGNGVPWINNAYFAHDDELNLYFLSRPQARHTVNLNETGGSIAVSVADTQQTGDGGRRGLQMEGVCREVTEVDYPYAAAVYRERFPAMPAGLGLYHVSVMAFRLFDEATFGREVWVDGRVQWPRPAFQ
ncbi:pyridoxamine 5'-phosphate oxidase family protein [Actinocrispum wychmicini]|uniref:Uncharacterized protein YhbP (UPF0306 family) n=1 Tax=Actinocrispum wychmicini TaxID=1213861 RepID=A0A4R2JY36_9PSEU|nr:pyridoxamine 5'-phosphate oxidase family protein [Actinocrispum wychmicini]TCO62286.1 uncharacterized protein YhbP (UPF0306 family) [Actinocrispum wychmicini]